MLLYDVYRPACQQQSVKLSTTMKLPLCCWHLKTQVNIVRVCQCTATLGLHMSFTHIILLMAFVLAGAKLPEAGCLGKQVSRLSAKPECNSSCMTCAAAGAQHPSLPSQLKAEGQVSQS
jgi:hypothetical protein